MKKSGKKLEYFKRKKRCFVNKQAPLSVVDTPATCRFNKKLEYTDSVQQLLSRVWRRSRVNYVRYREKR